MLDRVVLSVSEPVQIAEGLSQCEVGRKPSHSYGKWNKISLACGDQFLISYPRTDSESLARKSLKIQFNGFDIGSFENALMGLRAICPALAFEKFQLDSLECALDMAVENAGLQKIILIKDLWAFQQFSHPRSKAGGDNQILHLRGEGARTTATFGSPDNRQLKIYNKSLELVERRGLNEEASNKISPLSRIEIRLGSKLLSKAKIPFIKIQSWLADLRPLDCICLVDQPTISSHLDPFSIEGLIQNALVHYHSDGAFNPTTFKRAFSHRPSHEIKTIREIFQLKESIDQPDFQRMFERSTSRFFGAHEPGMPTMAFRLDGSVRETIPHSIIRFKRPKKEKRAEPSRARGGIQDVTAWN